MRQPWSLQRTLTAVLAGLGLLAVCTAGVLAYQQYQRVRTMTLHTLEVRGQVFATLSSVAMPLGGRGAATLLLRSLAADPLIIGAALDSADGRRFATYAPPHGATPVPVALGPDSTRVDEDRVVTVRAVTRGDQRIGTLYLAYDISPLRALAVRLTSVVAVVAAVTLALVLGVWRMLTTAVARPVLALAEAAERVGEHRDFTHRVEERGAAEIVRVARSFNGMLDDLTEQEVALSREEQRFRTLVTATAQMVWWTDPDGNVTEPLPTWQEFTGQSGAEVIGGGWIAALHPDDQAEALAAWQAAVLSRSTYETEYRVRRRDGVYRDFVARGVPVLGPDGEIREWIGTCTDITARREDSRALEESESRLRAVLDNSPAVIYVKDREGRYRLINRQYEELFGVREAEVRGRTDHDLFPAEFAAAFQRNDAQVLATGESVVLEETAPHAEGARTYLSVKFPLRDVTGAVQATCGISTDVTDLKAAERQMEAYARELERSNADLQQFAYVASHDLQEPLRMVANFTQLLAQRYGDRLDAEGLEFIEYAVDGATRMRTLIDDLLRYSRVQTRGREFEVVDMEEAFRSTCADLALAIDESGADITRDPLPRVVGDAWQLRQVWLNLLGNAIKFRQPGAAPQIHVSARRDGVGWVFAIRDNGIGMEPSQTDRIFTIFQRLHTRREYPGTGIGLALCRRIVERHGGRIAVTSAPGEGATFTFHLPDHPVRHPSEETAHAQS